jgi:hypothetical protein
MYSKRKGSKSARLQFARKVYKDEMRCYLIEFECRFAVI